MGGSKRARKALCRVLGVAMDSWVKVAREAYRSLLLGEGIEAGEAEKVGKRTKSVFLKQGFDRKKALEELRGGRKLSRAELIRLRVRYFSDGLVLVIPVLLIALLVFRILHPIWGPFMPVRHPKIVESLRSGAEEITAAESV